MQVYIADDNVEFANLCAKVAVQEGWSATVCANGRELITVLHQGEGPALLIVDIQMPELDGIEVIDELLGVDRKLRVRFITGGPDSSALAARMIAEARDIEVGRFLTKPIRMQDLREMLAFEAAASKA